MKDVFSRSDFGVDHLCYLLSYSVNHFVKTFETWSRFNALVRSRGLPRNETQVSLSTFWGKSSSQLFNIFKFLYESIILNNKRRGRRAETWGTR